MFSVLMKDVYMCLKATAKICATVQFFLLNRHKDACFDGDPRQLYRCVEDLSDRFFFIVL